MADRITWDEFFIGVAKLAALRSRDPNTKVGACIVKNNKIVSTGYNGMPKTCDEKGLPWNRQTNTWLNSKYPYVVHAELNAVLNAPMTDLNGCVLYVTLFPCNECAKVLLQCGIKEIHYLDDNHRDDSYLAARKMFNLSNVKLVKEDF